MKPTCVHVEQLTLSPALKAIILYFLLVFLCKERKKRKKKKKEYSELLCNITELNSFASQSSSNSHAHARLQVTSQWPRMTKTRMNTCKTVTQGKSCAHKSLWIFTCITHLGTRTMYSVVEVLLLLPCKRKNVLVGSLSHLNNVHTMKVMSDQYSSKVLSLFLYIYK